MPSDDLLAKYLEKIEKLRKNAKNASLSDEEIDVLFRECFETLKSVTKNRNRAQKAILYFLKVFLLLIAIVFIVYVILNVHQPTTSIVLRNVQGLIYPGLSLVRFLTVPVIKRYPSLTKLYDESCLVENPYFYVNEMECWPCQNVFSVIDLTDFTNHSLYHTGIPYISKINQSSVSYEKLIDSYLNNKDIFDNDADIIKSTDLTLVKVGDLVNYDPKSSESSDVRISWRINRMAPARVIRKLFPRPSIFSERSGQSVERYIMINGPKSFPYQLPNLECSYIFVIQGYGEQTVVLKPTRECAGECRTVSVTLKPSYVLWYNWWYWRPISLPTRNATEISISYVNSYC